MKEGLYLGPNGQIIEIKWSDGPGFNTGCMMYSVDSWSYLELTKEVKVLLQGYEYLGEIV